MTTINIAYTEAINPPNTTPVLTRDQVWRGLQRKIRYAQEFVEPIIATEVVEEKDNGNEVTRIATFAAGAMGSKEEKKAKEVCKSYYPTKVDFWQADNGALITNTISTGPSLEDSDLLMTYTFEFRDAVQAQAGSDEYWQKFNEMKKNAQGAVHSSIEAIRRMVVAGDL